MYARKSLLILCLIAYAANAEITIEKCLMKGSLTCLQTYAYRQIREMFSHDNIPLVGGLELVRSGEGARASSADVTAEVLENEDMGDVTKREVVLEQFVADKTLEVMSERSLRWKNPVGDVTSVVRSFVGEGRGKKILKALLPLVLGLKLKVVGLLVLSYLAIGLIAKQAVVASTFALLLSAFAAVRAYLNRHKHEYTETHYGLGAALPAFGHANHAGLDLGDIYSAQQASALAHALPYAAYKPLPLKARR